MNSRSLVVLQWVIIFILLIGYFNKGNDCPPQELPPPTRHIEVVEGKDTTKEKTVPVTRKAYKKHKDFLVAPTPNVAVTDTNYEDSSYVYSANLVDSNIDIYVDIPVIDGVIDSAYIRYNTKLPDQVIITDSIPYPVYIPVNARQMFIGGFLHGETSITGGPKVGIITRNKLITYGYDLFEKSHRVGIMWGIR